jgi:outer membrane lipoprotein-sorting protein
MIRKVLAVTIFWCAILCVNSSAQTVDELIKKNIEARGGLERLKAIKSLRMTGKVHTEGMKIPMVLHIKKPNLVRGEATLQGVTMVKAYDGETAWQINAFEGSKEPEVMTGYDAKEAIHFGDIDGPLFGYKTKGSTVELVGKEELEATPVYKLKVTMKDGDVRYIFLDAQNFLELKESETQKEEGSSQTVEISYSDYKAVAGVMIAHSTETKVNGEIDYQMNIEKVEINVSIDDSIFKMPKTTQEKKASGH